MTFPDMIGLAGEQLKIVYVIVTWVFIFMVYDFFRLKVSPKLSFHYETMLKDIFKAGRLRLRRVWVIVWGNNDDISIFANPTTASPSRSLFISHPIHRIVRPFHALAVHRVIFSGYVTAIGRVGVCEIPGGYGAAFRAVRRIWAAAELPKLLATLGAVFTRSTNFSSARALAATIPFSYRRICFIFDSTLGTRSSYHALYYTALR